MKDFKIKKEDIKKLIDIKGPTGCIATDRITVDGKKIGYMYKEEGYGMFPDSGWRFFEGNEDEEYINNPENSTVYDLNTICNYDPEIIPYLDSEVGSSFYRDENGKFVKENKNDE